jgi:NADPH-dependent 2,4-dienoyl-CoA reductase/sulfur reductase-like enzyme
VVRSSPLLGVSGFIHADPRTLQTDHDDVFAIGDVATIRLPNDKALPKAGVFAHSEAKVVVERIADKLDGKTSRAVFDGKGYCWVGARRRQSRLRRRRLLTPNPSLDSSRGAPGGRCTGGRWPSRSGGSTTGSRPQATPVGHQPTTMNGQVHRRD